MYKRLMSKCSTMMVCEPPHPTKFQNIWPSGVWSQTFLSQGLTPLHTAVTSHNAAAKELRVLENPCSYRKKELAEKSHTYIKCIKTLLLMGASIGTKVTKRIFVPCVEIWILQEHSGIKWGSCHLAPSCGAFVPLQTSTFATKAGSS